MRLGRVPLVLLILVVAHAAAAGGQRLSLADAMAQAREQNRDVAAARDRAQAAGQRAAQARGFRLPALSLQEIWVRTDSPAEVFAFKLNQQQFSFQDFVTSDPNRPEPLNTAISRVELSLPVYTGSALSGRISQADLAAAAGQGAAEWAGEQAALAVAEAYVMVDQAVEYVGLLERACETMRAHVAVARDYADQGMIVRSEVLRAEVELARLEDFLAEARGRVRVANANLAFRLGTDQGTSWELDPLPIPEALGTSLPEYLDSASSRKDLQAARNLLKAGELEERVRRAAYLPKVGVVGRADWVGDRLFGSSGSSTSIMAVASMNVFAGGADRAAAAAARFEARAGAEDVARFEQGVELEVRQAFEEANTAWQRHATETKAVVSAREVERITEDRFKTGVVKMIDLLDAATARREAETRELSARAEAASARLRLAVRSGRPPESVFP
jgi:outer membrane protein